MNRVNVKLQHYIENDILPRYKAFDKGHDINHVHSVIAESLNLATDFDVKADMVYTIAAYHDLGMEKGRERHHIYSGEILRADNRLLEWFSAKDIDIMSQAVEDHRASNQQEARSIYGKIVAEADRDIVPETIIRRTIQFGLKQNPEITDFDSHYMRAIVHIKEKYGENGYLKLQLHSKKNEQNLAVLRQMIKDEEQLKKLCRRIFDEEKTN